MPVQSQNPTQIKQKDFRILYTESLEAENFTKKCLKIQFKNLWKLFKHGECGNVVVKLLCYRPEGRRFESR